MKKYMIVSLLLLLLPLAIFAQDKIGLVGVKFLDIGIGARPIGMSSAYTAVSEGSEAIFWNPAGVAKITGTSVFGNMTDWWAGTGINSVSIVQQLGVLGSVGFFYSGFTSGQMEETTDDEIYGTGTFFSYNAFETGINYGRFLTDRFAFGVNMKIVREDYPETDFRNEHSTTAYALDLGGIYKSTIRDLVLGLSIRNYSADVVPSGTYDDYEKGVIENDTAKFRFYHLPMRFTLGAAMTAYETDMMKALVAVDMIHPSDNKERVNLGVELSIMDALSLRTGYTIGRDESVNQWSFGLGVRQAGTTGVGVDYSYTDGNILPDVHRFSLSLGL